jgi:hypothetical protein
LSSCISAATGRCLRAVTRQSLPVPHPEGKRGSHLATLCLLVVAVGLLRLLGQACSHTVGLGVRSALSCQLLCGWTLQLVS